MHSVSGFTSFSGGRDQQKRTEKSPKDGRPEKEKKGGKRPREELSSTVEQNEEDEDIWKGMKDGMDARDMVERELEQHYESVKRRIQGLAGEKERTTKKETRETMYIPLGASLSTSKGSLFPSPVNRNPEVVSDANDQVVAELARQKQISELRKEADAEPKNEATWLNLIALYRPLGSSLLAIRQYFTKLLEVYETALRHCTTSAQLKLGQLTCLGELADSGGKRSNLKSEWLQALKNFPNDRDVHRNFLEYVLSPTTGRSNTEPHQMTLRDRLAIVKTAFEGLTNSRSIEKGLSIESQVVLLDLVGAVCSLLKAGGLEKEAVAILQALVELNCSRSKVAALIPCREDDLKALKKNLSQFWESKYPRIGDPTTEMASTGWLHWHTAKTANNHPSIPFSSSLRLAVLCSSSSSNNHGATNSSKNVLYYSSLPSEQLSKEKRDHKTPSLNAYSRVLENLRRKKDRNRDKSKSSSTPLSKKKAALSFDPYTDPLLYFIQEERLLDATHGVQCSRTVPFAQVEPFLFLLDDGDAVFALLKQFLRFLGVSFPFQDPVEQPSYPDPSDSGCFEEIEPAHWERFLSLRGPMAFSSFSSESTSNRHRFAFVGRVLYRSLDLFPGNVHLGYALVLHHVIGELPEMSSGNKTLYPLRSAEVVCEWLFKRSSDSSEGEREKILPLWYSICLEQSESQHTYTPQAFLQLKKIPTLANLQISRNLHWEYLFRIAIANESKSQSSKMVLQSLSECAVTPPSQSTTVETLRNAFRATCKSNLDVLRKTVAEQGEKHKTCSLVLHESSEVLADFGFSVSCFAFLELIHSTLDEAVSLLTKTCTTLSSWYKIHKKTVTNSFMLKGNGVMKSTWSSQVSGVWRFLLRMKNLLVFNEMQVKKQKWLRKSLTESLSNSLPHFPLDPWLVDAFLKSSADLPLTIYEQAVKKLAFGERDDPPSAVLAIILDQVRVEKIFSRNDSSKPDGETFDIDQADSDRKLFFPASLNQFPGPKRVLKKELSMFAKSSSCTQALKQKFLDATLQHPQCIKLRRLFVRFLFCCGDIKEAKEKLEDITTACAASKEIWLLMLELLRPYMLWTENKFEREVFDRMESIGIVFEQES